MSSTLPSKLRGHVFARRERRPGVRAGGPARSAGQDGFALVVVIWAMGVTALLFTTYIAVARYRAIEAAATLGRAQAEAVADAGINLAIAGLLVDAAAGARTQATRGPRFCSIGASARLAVAVGNENGKVDLNTADPDLLRTVLIRVLGKGDRARSVVAAVQRLRQASAVAPMPGRSAHAAAAKAFRSVVEAGRVPGLDDADVAALLPIVTVHSGGIGINPTLAPVALHDMLAGDPAVPRRPGASEASPFFVADAPGSVYRVVADAVTAGGARFVRDAVVELDRGLRLGYAVREWREGAGQRGPDVRSAAPLPPC